MERRQAFATAGAVALSAAAAIFALGANAAGEGNPKPVDTTSAVEAPTSTTPSTIYVDVFEPAASAPAFAAVGGSAPAPSPALATDAPAAAAASSSDDSSSDDSSDDAFDDHGGNSGHGGGDDKADD
jgi:hypothetical protein